MLCFAPVSSLQAQRVPLNRAEQAAVDRAIDAGTLFLKQTQGRLGTWAADKGSHRVGYAALPGLTLLECGVPPSDPVIQRAARVIRLSARDLDTTYELSLAILFLDRLGNPRDRQLIQTFALRLVAGQTTTGGWSYKCPKLNPVVQRDILVTLRQLDPASPPVVRAGKPGSDPKTGPPAGKKPAGPGGFPGDRRPPGGEAIAGKPAEGEVPGRPAAKDPDKKEGPAEGSGEKTPGDTGPGATPEAERKDKPGNTVPAPGKPGEVGFEGKPDRGKNPPGGGKQQPSERVVDLGSRRWAWCIKSGEGFSSERKRFKDEPEVVKPPVVPSRAVVIPSRLRHLAVFQDPKLMLKDPKDRPHQPLMGTTDNSNTQFAILALWAAQRHGVPMKRTLRLMVHRFKTSQNNGGGWGYHYLFGGGTESPAMTAVGLLGLAVGHGLATQGHGADQKPVNDPAILKGFVALSKHIGKPTGQWRELAQSNLYLMWSIERVAVLYSLPAISNKDWYRWGAEMLVANQGQFGNWDKGGYPGASPVIDTCFALLFLKRANLTEDLSARLPIDAEELEASITKTTNPPPKDPPADSANKKPEDDKDQLAGGVARPGTEPPLPIGGPTTLPSDPGIEGKGLGTSPGGDQATGDSTATKSKGRTLWIILLIVVCALILLGAALLIGKHFTTEEEEVVQEPAKRKKPKKKVKKAPASSGA
jgi:hypothetical protein